MHFWCPSLSLELAGSAGIVVGTRSGAPRRYICYQTTAALLSDGKVLVAGGTGFRGMDYYVLDSAQVYDPVTGSWTAIANMHAKASLTAALLQPDGKVLVVGSLCL